MLQTHALPLGYGAININICNFRKNGTFTENKILPLMLRSKILIGAEDEIRTRDVHLGKVTLYH